VQKEELTTCRIDHYQTVDKVHVSVFAKQVDKERSVVVLKDEGISLDLYLPGSKRFIKELVLFGPIDSASSSFQYFGTKVSRIRRQDYNTLSDDLGRVNSAEARWKKLDSARKNR